MESSANVLLQKETDALILEIETLKKELRIERQQHRHWEELAMIFHDALWNELKYAKEEL